MDRDRLQPVQAPSALGHISPVDFENTKHAITQAAQPNVHYNGATSRWKIERTLAWFTGYRRLNHHYECNPRHYAAFASLAATLTCYKKLTT